MSEDVDQETYDKLAAIGYVPKRKQLDNASSKVDGLWWTGGKPISTPVPLFWSVLCVLSVIGAMGLLVLGLLMLTQATLGVGIIAMACLAAILARIAQAAGHHSQLMRALREGRDGDKSIT